MIRITDNTDIKRMTTFGLKAECGRLIEYDTTDDLLELFNRGMLKNVLPIGGGSNLLFTTGRYDGTILHCTDRSVETGNPDAEGMVTLKAAAGCVLDELCAMTCRQTLWGLENLSGIPGEAGGAAVQNVGAYGTEFKDVVTTVHCFDITSGETTVLDNADCRYGYRDSVFKHLKNPGSLVVTGVTMKLWTTPRPRLGYAALASAFGNHNPSGLTPMMLRDAVLNLRDGKLPSPTLTGSAGSFFKNPVVSAEFHSEMQNRMNRNIPGHVLHSGEVKLSAAWLIDNAGCKSFKCGAAGVWQSQPLVLVNTDGTATGHDVVELENKIRHAVMEKFGVDLIPEVIHI